jgi:alpha-methylacyl-CoA racemase
MAGPLAGLRVLELAGIGPGPFATSLLGDLGADVVRVDRPGSAPEFGSAEFDLINRSKRSIVVDLKHPAGPSTVLALAEKADVLVEGFRPGVAERLGVGPDTCLAVNPRLIYGRMTGWGQHGPRAPEAGHDINYIALTGVLNAIGRKDGPPQIPLNLLGDFAAGSMYLVVGILSALIERATSGRGQVIDAAIVDGAVHLGTMFWGLKHQGLWSDERGTNVIDSGRAYYDVYRCADGKYVALGAIEERFFVEFCRILGIDPGELPDRQDPARSPVLRDRIQAAFAERTRDEWSEVFAGTDACVTPVLAFDEAAHDPHLGARGAFVTVDGVTQPAPAPRFSRSEPAVTRRPPRPGEHSHEVLRSWGVSLTDTSAVVQLDRATTA